MITISGKALGRKAPLFEDWSIPFPPDLGDSGVTLRDVIARVVRAEVTAFRQRQRDRLVFRALTEREIADAARKGKVEMGGSETGTQEVDEDDAIATAWQAFEDGLFLVLVDGEEQRTLDAQVFLKPDSRLMFVRLTMLAGG
jgi:hypothetical protein